MIKTLGRWESTAYQRYIRIPRELLACTFAAQSLVYWTTVIYSQLFHLFCIHPHIGYSWHHYGHVPCNSYSPGLGGRNLRFLLGQGWRFKNPPLLMMLPSQALDFTGYLWRVGSHVCTSAKPHRPWPRSVADTAHAEIASFQGVPYLGTRLNE